MEKIMSKTIKITPKLEERIVKFCDDELNYHINECADGCVEYKNEILAQLQLLNLLGYREMSKEYKEQYRECLTENRKHY